MILFLVGITSTRKEGSCSNDLYEYDDDYDNNDDNHLFDDDATALKQSHKDW